MTEHSAATGAGDDAEASAVLAEVLRCALAWEPQVRIMGNVQAGAIARSIRHVMGLMQTGATAIRAKDAEIERLTAEVAMWKGLQDGTVAATRAEIERLTRARNRLLAAIEYTLLIQSPHLANGWLNDWTHGDEVAMAQLDGWIAAKGREARAAHQET